MPNFISENQIEQALVQKLQHLHGFDALDCYTENAEDLNDGSNRAHKRDVITYCGGGIAATSVALELETLGHKSVKVYDASLTEWVADPALPMEP